MSIFDRLGDGCLTQICEAGGKLHDRVIHDTHDRESKAGGQPPRIRLNSRASAYLRFFRGAKLPEAGNENDWMPKPV